MSIERATHLRSDGARIIVSLRGKAICTESGHVVYCSVRDITARIRMEEESKLHQAQLIHANRMTSLGKIVSGVAHEVNNPNNLVMFNAPMILSAWEDAVPVLDAYSRENGDFPLGGLPYSEMREVVPKMAAGISDASARIKAIVENMKNFARRDTSRTPAAFQVNDVVRMAVTILNHEILRATHRFEVSYGENLSPVMGSAQQLEQVVVNLLNNAFQALPSNRHGIRVDPTGPGNGGGGAVRGGRGRGDVPRGAGADQGAVLLTRLDSGGWAWGCPSAGPSSRSTRGRSNSNRRWGRGPGRSFAFRGSVRRSGSARKASRRRSPREDDRMESGVRVTPEASVSSPVRCTARRPAAGSATGFRS